MMAECTQIVQISICGNLACYYVLFGNIREMIFYKAENVTQAVRPSDDSLGNENHLNLIGTVFGLFYYFDIDSKL